MKKANASQFRKLLERTTPLPLTPEVKLIIAVLVQAWADADQIRGDWGAVHFFSDYRGRLYAETIGIDGDFLREIFVKHHSKSYEARP